MKSKSVFVIGSMPLSNALWLEYHSIASDNIYITVVRNEDDIKKLKSLNLVVGSTESYCSYSELIKIAMKAALSVPKDKIDLVVEMRFSMCRSITIIKNFENTVIKD